MNVILAAQFPRLSPRELVKPLLTRGITHAPSIGCQYRGVYRHRDKWRATVKLTWRGGGQVRRIMTHVARQQNSPLDAAVKLAEWFLRWLGPDWGEIVRRHRRFLWNHSPWKAKYSQKRQGWALSVWVDGDEYHRVGCPRDGSDREVSGEYAGEPRLFPSWEAARDYLQVWLRVQYGPNGYLRMWRARAASKFPE